MDNRLLEDVADTAPFKWNGGQSGPGNRMRSAHGEVLLPVAELQRRGTGPTWWLHQVDSAAAQPLPPGGWRTDRRQQERGKAIFERTRRKDGTPIPETNQCAVCHSGPHYTNQKLADVGTGKPTDRSPLFDTPQLTNVALTAPYLHDGSARTLEEIWTVFNPKTRTG